MKPPSNLHAILSPSSAYRWLSCSASPALEMNEPDTASVYAQEGTLAHAICESKLKAYIDHGNAGRTYILRSMAESGLRNLCILKKWRNARTIIVI